MYRNWSIAGRRRGGLRMFTSPLYVFLMQIFPFFHNFHNSRAIDAKIVRSRDVQCNTKELP